ncbi:uncharacterized protein J4E79_010869 [Alternaria viburni]|uniref:uncharacterized protein n=1 Tax=Alternaria viburni TaxID=566460 RepID=UPI0020C20472|nr:uncharacterized protein J4E79_010869 [Alternaria viburni]KAI4645331.1 hypothetical protein J4E79_010869 [Alternaria viburni]
MASQDLNQSDGGYAAESKRDEAQSLVSTKRVRGAHMEMMAVEFGQLSASKASPMPFECYNLYRREFVTNPLSTVTLVAKLGDESATCTLPRESAGVLSRKFRTQVEDPQNTDSVVTMDGYEYIVVEMIVQYILDADYHLDDTQELANYKLTHLKKAQLGTGDDSITVRVEETPTELHLKVYVCAKRMEISQLQAPAAKKFWTTLRKDRPTAEELVNMVEKYKLYDPSENTKEEILHAIATYGAMRRSVWLQEDDTKYLDLLGTPRYAIYEARAERDLEGYKLEHDIPERIIAPDPTSRHQASRKRLLTDSTPDTRSPKSRTVGSGPVQRGHISSPLLQRPGSSNTYQPTVEDHSDSPTPRRRDHGSSATHTNKALPPTPTPSELDRSWQSMGGSKASQGEKAASTPMKPASGLLRTPRPGSSLRRSQTVRGEADGSDDIDGPSLYDDFNPPFASHSPQGPSPVAPRTARNQGGDQPTRDQTKVDRQDTTEHALPENNISADENADESTFIPLVSSSDHGMDDNTEVPRIEFSFDEGDTIRQVPQVPVLAPVASARSTSDETGGQKKKEDTSMTDVSGDGEDGVKVDDGAKIDDGVKAEDRMEE